MDKLHKLMMKLPRANLINLTYNALDLMQQFNGRTHYYCILRAIGAIETGEDKWRLPSLKIAKEHTND